MTVLTSLPVEIVTQVLEMGILDTLDLASVAKTNRFLHPIANRALYRHDIKHRNSSALIWAAVTGELRTDQIALGLGANPNVLGSEDPRIYRWWERMWPRRHKSALDESLDVQLDHIRECGYFAVPCGTPLHYAVRGGRDKIVRLLLEAGASTNVPSRALCDCQEHYDFGVDVNEFCPKWFPLHHALCKQHVSTADLLLNHGASTELASKTEWPCPHLIHCAAAQGLESLVDRALESDMASGRVYDTPETSLHYALEKWGNESVIKKLIAAGADLDAQGNGDVSPPIYRACEIGNFAAAQILLEAGAKTTRPAIARPGLPSVPAKPLMHVAVTACVRLVTRPSNISDRLDEAQVEFIRSLLGLGHNVNETFPKEANIGTVLYTVLSAAVSRVDNKSTLHVMAVIELLLQAGADPNNDDQRASQPLLSAIENFFGLGHLLAFHPEERGPTCDWEEIVKILLQHGAHLDVPGRTRNGDYITPLGLAIKHVGAKKDYDRYGYRFLRMLLDHVSESNLNTESLNEILGDRVWSTLHLREPHFVLKDKRLMDRYLVWLKRQSALAVKEVERLGERQRRLGERQRAVETILTGSTEAGKSDITVPNAVAGPRRSKTSKET
ncbi:ankyrin repeat-containing domain protein [Xylariomycetidae sp. FL2044]|nr:ankyrin repeat-containing domain protein [Xylariomycetidae sp. FL2044]